MAIRCRSCGARIPDLFATTCPGCKIPVTKESVDFDGALGFEKSAPDPKGESRIFLFLGIFLVVGSVLFYLLLAYMEQTGQTLFLPSIFAGLYLAFGKWGVASFCAFVAALFLYKAVLKSREAKASASESGADEGGSPKT